MPTAIHQQVRDARDGTHPRLICRVTSGWVVLGTWQRLRGYCLLLPDPVVRGLNDMDADARREFLYDMTRVGDAVLAVTDAVHINYEMLGNVEPALHAHVFPRFDNEPAVRRTSPVWLYDWSAGPDFDAQRDRPMMDAIADHLRADD